MDCSGLTEYANATYTPKSIIIQHWKTMLAQNDYCIPNNIVLPAQELVTLIDRWLHETTNSFSGTHFITTGQYLDEAILSVTQICAGELYDLLVRHNDTQLIIAEQQKRKLESLTHSKYFMDRASLVDEIFQEKITVNTNDIITILAIWYERAKTALTDCMKPPFSVKAGDTTAHRQLLDYFRIARYLSCHSDLYGLILVLLERRYFYGTTNS